MLTKLSNFPGRRVKSCLIFGKKRKSCFVQVSVYWLVCPVSIYTRALTVFCFRLNTCPFQGSRTIRTEEAVLISLAALSTPIAKSSRDTEKAVDGPDVEFSDEAPSDESSDEDDDGIKEEIMKGEDKVEEENDASSESSGSEEE
jgi:hypothetical protein